MAKIIMVGPFPPHINGVSVINAFLFNLLNSRKSLDDVVIKAVTSSMLRSEHFGKFFNFLKNLFKVVYNHEFNSMYISIAGGKYQLFDISYLALARLLKMEITIHHHSFKYLNRYSILTAILCKVAGQNTHHIALGSSMQAKLHGMYRLNGRISVISNVAYLDSVSILKTRSSLRYNVGFLSNICEGKGGDLVTLIDRICMKGYAIDFFIAGPFASESLELKMRELESIYSSVKLIGPVFGEGKETFYRSIDLFIYPTKYRNEAEPVVLWEAIQAGVPFISYDRGVIGSLAKCAPFSFVVSGPDEMYTRIIKSYQLHTDDQDSYLSKRKALIEYFLYSRDTNKKLLNDLCQSLL